MEHPAHLDGQQLADIERLMMLFHLAVTFSRQAGVWVQYGNLTADLTSSAVGTDDA